MTQQNRKGYSEGNLKILSASVGQRIHKQHNIRVTSQSSQLAPIVTQQIYVA